MTPTPAGPPTVTIGDVNVGDTVSYTCGSTTVRGTITDKTDTKLLIRHLGWFSIHANGTLTRLHTACKPAIPTSDDTVIQRLGNAPGPRLAERYDGTWFISGLSQGAWVPDPAEWQVLIPAPPRRLAALRDRNGTEWIPDGDGWTAPGWSDAPWPRADIESEFGPVTEVLAGPVAGDENDR